MKVYEFGTEHEKNFVMFQCAAEPWWVFKASAETMAKDCHVYLFIADGHDEQGTEFVSIEKTVRDAADYLREKGVSHVEAMYGVSMGGASVIRFLATEDIGVDKAIIDAGITPYPYPRLFCRLISVWDWITVMLGTKSMTLMKLAMPPERWTPEGEDPDEHYRKIFDFEKHHFSPRTMLNLLTVPVERMNEIAEHPAQTGMTDFRPVGYDVRFEKVGFSYEQDKNVLNDVSFTAKQGEVTALVGPSGGGKTTVSRLAARFWDVSRGRITVGGQDISQIDPETLLGVYSIVFQDVTLFNNSILENIRVGKKDASDEEVLAAAKLANCDEFALKLPQGYATVIGENGSELSGGERQRISIARALLKDAPIILLDEATASLDVENETKVQGALSRLLAGKTVLVIAHRMRTVEAADKIVVLSDGTVAEEGSPDELLANENGLFRRMTQLQAASSGWSI